MAVYPEEEMREIRQQIWYHGSITRVVAEHRLDDALDGTYLFRESETRPGFSLSLKVPGRVKHFMIAKKDTGLWHLVGKQKEFDTIFSLIKYHTETETNSSDHTRLMYPCPAVQDENPYVEMRDDVVVDEDALANAKRIESEAKKKTSNSNTDRRGSQTSQTSKSSRDAKKAHRYEHVVPGQL